LYQTPTQGIDFAKCLALMMHNEKTCGINEEGQQPKTQEYLLIMELQCKKRMRMSTLMTWGEYLSKQIDNIALLVCLGNEYIVIV